MTKGLSNILKELLPQYGSEVEKYSSISNEYNRIKSEAEEKSAVNTFNNAKAPMDGASSKIQEKHHRLMEKIRNKGVHRDYRYQLKNDLSEHVVSESEEIIQLCQDEIDTLESKRKRNLFVFSGAVILAVLITAFGTL